MSKSTNFYFNFAHQCFIINVILLERTVPLFLRKYSRGATINLIVSSYSNTNASRNIAN